MEKTVWIQGINVKNEPVSIEVPESLGRAIKEAIANAHKASAHPEGAAVLIELPQDGYPNTARIAIAPNSTPVAVIDMDRSHPKLSTRFTVALDVEQEDVVRPLARRFSDLNGHLVNLVLNDPKK